MRDRDEIERHHDPNHDQNEQPYPAPPIRLGPGASGVTGPDAQLGRDPRDEAAEEESLGERDAANQRRLHHYPQTRPAVTGASRVPSGARLTVLGLLLDPMAPSRRSITLWILAYWRLVQSGCRLPAVVDDELPRLQAVQRALADPLRIRLFELLTLRPQSAKELAAHVGMSPDRLYHHLAQLEDGKIIEVADFRRLPGGKVERIYAPAAVEPDSDDPGPAELARFLNVVLETTRADVNAASLANEAGEDRRLSLGRTGFKLNEEHLEQLRSNIEALLRAAMEHPDDDGVWTTFLWTAIDRQDRRTAKPTAPRRSSARTKRE